MSAAEAQRAENVFGFRVAGLGRLAFCLVFVFYIPVGIPQQTRFEVMIGLLLFTAISALQMAMADRDWFQRWGKYLFVALDLAVIYVAVVFRNPLGDNLWTLVQSFRLEYFLFFFIYLGTVALTNSPGTVLYVGLTISVAWIITAFAVMSQPETLTWANLPDSGGNPDPSVALQLFLHPDFFDSAARLMEALSMMAITLLLSLAAWRGRMNFRRFAEAEQERRLVRETFGKYVPEEVARELLSHDGVLVPERREATILFADIEGFTSLSENAGPDHVLEMLNDWFDRAGEAVGGEGGIVTQFQGDGLLATFSAPLAGANPAGAAVAAAKAMLDAAARDSFSGETIRIRVGIATGPVVAGALGGRERQSYTVIGDTVNLAARLEQLNKAQGTRILVCQNTAAALDAGSCRLVTHAAVRGRSGEMDVFEPAA